MHGTGLVTCKIRTCENRCHTQQMYSSFNGSYFAVIVIIVLVVVWGGIWKAIALRRAGRENNLAWFVILCILNTVGILDSGQNLFQLWHGGTATGRPG